MVFTRLWPGVCRNGAEHDFSTSGWYTIPIYVPPIGGDSSWGWCRLCEALVHTGESEGVCIAGGPHGDPGADESDPAHHSVSRPW